MKQNISYIAASFISMLAIYAPAKSAATDISPDGYAYTVIPMPADVYGSLPSTISADGKVIAGILSPVDSSAGTAFIAERASITTPITTVCITLNGAAISSFVVSSTGRRGAGIAESSDPNTGSLVYTSFELSNISTVFNSPKNADGCVDISTLTTPVALPPMESGLSVSFTGMNGQNIVGNAAQPEGPPVGDFAILYKFPGLYSTANGAQYVGLNGKNVALVVYGDGSYAKVNLSTGAAELLPTDPNATGDTIYNAENGNGQLAGNYFVGIQPEGFIYKGQTGFSPFNIYYNPANPGVPLIEGGRIGGIDNFGEIVISTYDSSTQKSNSYIATPTSSLTKRGVFSSTK